MKAGTCALDDVGRHPVLADPLRLVAEADGMLLSTRSLPGAGVASAASAEVAYWYTLDSTSHPLPLTA